ncbi:MAG: S8 family serine peptidase [Planctomycetota bacterium]|nr:S8 family serine peptidase [Blastopirellula sp.]
MNRRRRSSQSGQEHPTQFDPANALAPQAAAEPNERVRSGLTVSPQRRKRTGMRERLGFQQLEQRLLLAADLQAYEHVPGELLVQFVAQATPAQRAAARAQVGAVVAETIETTVMVQQRAGNLERLSLPAGTDLNAAIKALKETRWVEFAEPNYIYRRAATSNDTYYTSGSLWGMYSSDSPLPSGPNGTTNQFGSQAERAWSEGFTGSSNVIVGVIDEGIQVSHPDLDANVWVNPYETAGDGIDNDGNGYVDDIYGWDFVNNDASVYDVGQDAHGTHVAGTIGGEGGNNAGVVGVNWNIKMISAKFLGADGGTLADAVRAVDYLTDLKTRHGINLVASNNSWGGGGYSQALHDAIIRSANANILFVAAAGNSTSNNDTGGFYPSNYNTTVGTSTQAAASYDAVLAVASIASNGSISSFSSYGQNTVDLGAPGSDIWSSVPSNSYSSFSGTSMATPHVTGAAALFASVAGPGVTAAWIRSALLDSTTPTPSLVGKTVTGGRLNAYEALQRASYLDLDQEFYNLPETAMLRVGHPSANANPNVRETVTVSIRSTTESTPELVQLLESGPNTGIFQGEIQLVAGEAVGDGKLQAKHGDQLLARYAALNVQATANVDTVAPVISGLTAVPKTTSVNLTWLTDEAATTQVFYGTSPSNLNQQYLGETLDTNHEATLSGLSPTTTYYYQVRSRDAAGNLSVSEVGSFTTKVPSPVLFVDDDMGENYDRFFIIALQENGFDFDVWDSSMWGRTPTSAELSAYTVVVWNTGYEYSGPGAGLTSGEQATIANYLNAGGRMFISGQDILYTGVTSSFRQNYLKVASFTNDVRTSNHIQQGVAGNEIGNGLSLSISRPYDYPGIYSDGLSPVSGAEGTLRHGSSATTNPFSTINYRGNYQTGGFGMVFMAVPFETISTSSANPNNQKMVMARIVEYLLDNGAQPGVTVSAPSPSSSTTEAGGAVTFTVKLATLPLANVVIPISTSDATEGLPNVSSLTFTPANWGVPQTVIVAGVDDTLDDGNVAYSIQLGAIASSDSAYNGLNPADVNLVNVDNEFFPDIAVSSPSSVAEGNSGTVTVNFTVTLSAAATETVSVDYATTSQGFSDPATSGNDYTPVSGRVDFAPGEVSKTVPVSVRGDRLIERDELFGLLLSNPQRGYLADELAEVAIADNDGWAYPQEIDFGTELSPIKVGAAAVGALPYTAAKGLGWYAGLSNLQVVDRAVGTPALRDVALTSNSSLAFDVPNGNYLVLVTYGDAILAHDQMRLTLEGSARPLVSTAANQFLTRAYAVPVTDGQLNLVFSDQGGADPNVAITGIAFQRR